MTQPKSDGQSPSALADLLARVQVAEGPNYELECALFEALALPTDWFGSRVESHFRIGGTYGFNTEDGYRHLDCVRPPAYTASVDAALRLCGGLLTAWEYKLSGGPETGDTEAWAGATITTLKWPAKQRHHSGERPTPALALLAALLEALIASGQAGTAERQTEPREDPDRLQPVKSKTHNHSGKEDR